MRALKNCAEVRHTTFRALFDGLIPTFNTPKKSRDSKEIFENNYFLERKLNVCYKMNMKE